MSRLDWFMRHNRYTLRVFDQYRYSEAVDRPSWDDPNATDFAELVQTMHPLRLPRHEMVKLIDRYMTWATAIEAAHSKGDA